MSVQKRIESTKEQQAQCFNKMLNIFTKIIFDEIKTDLELLVSENEDDLDRGKGKHLLNKYIEYQLTETRKKFIQ